MAKQRREIKMVDDFETKNYAIRNPRLEVGTVKVRKGEGTDTYRIPGKGGVLRVSGEIVECSDGLVVKEI